MTDAPAAPLRSARHLRIAIACDHGGFEQKQHLVEWLRGRGCDVEDFGTDSDASVDYPDYAALASRAVAAGEADFGVLVCGTGLGMSIAANKIGGIRAAACTSPEFASLARRHNDANVLALSGRFVSLADNEQILAAFLDADFEGGRHARRVAKISELES